MEFGLNEREIEPIRDVFRSHPEVREVRIYGSRAMGSHRKESDIDLAVWGELGEREIRAIAGELDELPLPYLFDVERYGAIRHEGLRKHIDTHGRTLYSRDSVCE